MTIQVQLIVEIVRLASRGPKRQRNTNKAVKKKIRKIRLWIIKLFSGQISTLKFTEVNRKGSLDALYNMVHTQATELRLRRSR